MICQSVQNKAGITRAKTARTASTSISSAAIETCTVALVLDCVNDALIDS